MSFRYYSPSPSEARANAPRRVVAIRHAVHRRRRRAHAPQRCHRHSGGPHGLGKGLRAPLQRLQRLRAQLHAPLPCVLERLVVLLEGVVEPRGLPQRRVQGDGAVLSPWAGVTKRRSARGHGDGLAPRGDGRELHAGVRAHP